MPLRAVAKAEIKSGLAESVSLIMENESGE